MLKSIICDKFEQKEILFHSGLNSIIGDDDATNSIGKTIALMIIDFTFGGDDYIHKNGDVVSNIGDHEFKFVFEFEDGLHFFKRGTLNYKTVLVCDIEFNITDYITSFDFSKFLQDKYRCHLDGLSFRDTVGRFFRIYGKENTNEKKPIQYYDKELASASIRNLLMVFDKYKGIEYLDATVSNAKDSKLLISKAMKKNLLPSVNKSVYVTNKESIRSLEKKLEKVKVDTIAAIEDIISIVSEDILKLREQRSKLKTRLSLLDGRKKRINININNNIAPINHELEKLIEYFPNINIRKITEVESFHIKITANLKNEMLKSLDAINSEIEFLEFEIKSIDREIVERLNVKDVPKVAVDTLIKIGSEINQLMEMNKYFESEQQLESTIKTTSKELKQEKERVLAEVTSLINGKMAELNTHIYSDGRRPPTLAIFGNSYRFDRFEDTGTGSAYVSLITYDLSILSLTCLPALIHDLPLLKNIEDHAFSKIVSIYSRFSKQIFISIDKVPSYSPDTQAALRESKVLKLSKDHLLFGLNWKQVIN